ncbi:hypothetical protein Aperf_G00000051183 [Anoplocephala perfoliata]
MAEGGHEEETTRARDRRRARRTLQKIMWMDPILFFDLLRVTMAESVDILRSTMVRYNDETRLAGDRNINVGPTLGPVKIAICGRKLTNTVKRRFRRSLKGISSSISAKFNPPYESEETGKHQIHWIHRCRTTGANKFDFFAYHCVIYVIRSKSYRILEKDYDKVMRIMTSDFLLESRRPPKIFIVDICKNNSFSRLLTLFYNTFLANGRLFWTHESWNKFRIWRLCWNGRRYTNLRRAVKHAISSFSRDH